MRTMRGFSVAAMLALVSAAPAAAQQALHPQGRDQLTPQEGSAMMADHRATRSSRIGAATSASRMPRTTAVLPHAYREGVRRATRVPPAVAGWHDAGAISAPARSVRPRASPARRANGPTRIPRG